MISHDGRVNHGRFLFEAGDGDEGPLIPSEDVGLDQKVLYMA